jgi:hypothetical protein
MEIEEGREKEANIKKRSIIDNKRTYRVLEV